MRRAAFWLGVLTMALPAVGQQAIVPDPCGQSARASFDVVSIKPSQTPSNSSSMHGTPDGILFTGSLRRLILEAFNLRDFQVAGGPDWVTTSTWTVTAKSDTPDGDFSKLTQDQMQALIEKREQQVRALLVSRYQLKCHIETKELPVYELVQAKGGSKLKQTTAEERKRNSSSSTGRGSQIHETATGVSADRIATLLANAVDRMVVDKTGLAGSYDFTLDWVRDNSPEAQNADAPAGPTIFTALEEQLGLKLVPAKGPVPALVIDSVEKPSEN